jgi:hypothetical protein
LYIANRFAVTEEVFIRRAKASDSSNVREVVYGLEVEDSLMKKYMNSLLENQTTTFTPRNYTLLDLNARLTI